MFINTSSILCISYKIKKISFNDPYNFQIFKNESVYFLAMVLCQEKVPVK